MLGCRGLVDLLYSLSKRFKIYALPLNNVLGLSFGSSWHLSFSRFIPRFFKVGFPTKWHLFTTVDSEERVRINELFLFF